MIGHPFSTLVDVIRNRGSRQAGRLAFRFLDDDLEPQAILTYGRLDARARAIAAALQEKGAAGERVLLLYPPGLDYVSAFAGCLYAGSIAVPAYPPRPNQTLARLETVVGDAEARFGLTTGPILQRIQQLKQRQSINLSLKWVVTDSLIDTAASDWTPQSLTGDSVALLQYTSGSTGNPKGVVLTHGNLLHNSAALRGAFQYSTESHCVSWLPFYHDMGLIGALIQPLVGGFPCTLMAPVSFLQRPIRWLRAISRYRGTISGGPNFAYRLCADKVKPDEMGSLNLSCWQVAFNGAEPINPSILERFCAMFEPCGFRRSAFLPCYGLAEATLFVSGSRMGEGPKLTRFRSSSIEDGLAEEAGEGEDGSRTLVSCGMTGLENDVVVVRPGTDTVLGEGEIGEILVAGPSIAQGYWRKPAESQQVFNAVLSDTARGPYLRTGDMGFRKNSELYLTGRLKDLIIIRGVNHYPQDIELTVENSHPALRGNCGAAFTIDVDGQEELVVINEVDRHYRGESDELIRAIRSSVSAAHELQTYGISLLKAGSIPKTSSGKIKRWACREAFLKGTLNVSRQWRGAQPSTSASIIEGPSQDCSQRDMAIWLIALLSSQLGIEADLDPDLPISMAGIDSLQAVGLAYQIQRTLGVSLSMVRLLESSSINYLAAELHAELNRGLLLGPTPAGSGTEPLSPPVFALSKGQQSLWYLYRLAPDNPILNIAVAATVDPGLDVPALERCLRLVVQRHASLRTVFDMEQGEPVQRIRSEIASQIDTVDALGWSDAQLHDRLVEEANRPFDLEKGPLHRALLFSRPGGSHVLLLVINHMVADFWSLEVIATELALLYDAEIGSSQRPLSAPSSAYATYVRRQNEMLAGAEGLRLWEYWRKQLKGAPVLNLPADRARPAIQSYSGLTKGFKISRHASERIRRVGRGAGATLYTVLMAAFNVLLHRYSGQDDLLVGSLVAGRCLPDVLDTVGYFVNPIVVRSNPSGNPGFDEFLGKTKKTVLAAFEHQDYPFLLLVERLQPERDTARPPLFQVMLAFQKDHFNGRQTIASLASGRTGLRIRLGSLSMESLVLERRISQFDLTIVASDIEGEIGFSAEFNTDLFDAISIDRLGGHLQRLLEGIGADPRTKIRELPLLDPAQRNQLVIQWNDSLVDYPTDVCIHELFQARASTMADAVAVEYGDRHLSYAALNLAANGLALELRQMNVGAETLVGVSLSRSIEMVVALLGILKAGGAYIPLDPNYPKDRLAQIVQDSCLTLVICQRGLATSFPSCGALYLDVNTDRGPEPGYDDPISEVSPDNPAYVIYTSGSSGRPKGVMVSHRSVMNFFAGMDRAIGCSPGDSCLAVTSISFDISVLELLWTLTNGVRVILLPEPKAGKASHHPRLNQKNRETRFSLFYFATNEVERQDDNYRLLLEGAKFADKSGFEAVWTPERHFHSFGGLYPNPSVTGAALAVLTERVGIRAGSVVMPLHNPIRVAEEWALVDNLSNGRVGIAFASGWHSDDFAFFPENYSVRKEATYAGMETVRRLWRGERVRVVGGAGNEIEIRVFPSPKQKDLPVWLTAAGTPDTFIKAGESGASVLTHLLGQTPEEVRQKVALYRDALTRSGYDPESRSVTLMLHTLIGDDFQMAMEMVRRPFTNYLKSSVGLIGNLIRSLGLPLNLDSMSPKDLEDLLDYAFDRYSRTGALFGTVDSCLENVELFKDMGVDEIACLIDFGVDTDTVLSSLSNLSRLKDKSNSQSMAFDPWPVMAISSRPVLMQCTPSTLKMFMLNPMMEGWLRSLRVLLLGGEALPGSVVDSTLQLARPRITNMYGPTETTIWSSTCHVEKSEDTIPIGRPIANTSMYVLDSSLGVAPLCAEGVLHIGGPGVARGYHGRPELTASKFVPDPFSSEPGSRLYNTGDMARHSSSGQLHFLGRMDNQVKLRGYRIELEEIEGALRDHPSVEDAVVTAFQYEPGDKRLAAYLVSGEGKQIDPGELRQFLASKLPDYMMPATFTKIERIPLTSNGKVHRNALPRPDLAGDLTKPDGRAPRTNLEKKIADVWKQVLKMEKLSVHDNFFDMGGHSLLMAQANSLLREDLQRDIPLVKMLEHPTISALAEYLAGENGSVKSLEQMHHRGRKQREGLKRLRARI